ncbi:MAG: zf-HC2 domain-containing protein [Gaiellales bacterium]
MNDADLSCQELVELVTAYLDGGLSETDRRRFDDHLTECPGCTAYVAQLEKVIELAGTLEPDDLSPAARDALLAEFRDWKAR